MFVGLMNIFTVMVSVKSVTSKINGGLSAAKQSLLQADHLPDHHYFAHLSDDLVHGRSPSSVIKHQLSRIPHHPALDLAPFLLLNGAPLLSGCTASRSSSLSFAPELPETCRPGFAPTVMPACFSGLFRQYLRAHDARFPLSRKN